MNSVSALSKYKQHIRRASLLCCLMVVFISNLFGQSRFFLAPLDIPLSVVGTFGELRPDHFHTGIDFTTKGKTGKNVLAVADGHVSRIKVSATGYGKAVYIDHPGGYTTVYGHLEAFSVVVDDYIRRKQYESQSFEIDISPDEELFRVRRGDIIGYSGNSGSSEGPHLHFEIRSTHTEHPLNPLLFGIGAADNKCPVIQQLMIFPANSNCIIEGKSSAATFDAGKKDSIFVLRLKDTILISGSVYLGVRAADIQNSLAETGLYSQSVYVDGMCVHAWKIDSLDFAQGRYINTFIDYGIYKRTGNCFVTSRIQIGNRLPLYSKSPENGILSFNDSLVHSIMIIAADFAGNRSTLCFKIRNTVPESGKIPVQDPPGNIFYYGMSNRYSNGNIVVELPADALYDSVIFTCEEKKKLPGAFSATFAVLDRYTPVHSYFDMGIKPDTEVPPSLEEKIVLACIDGSVRQVSNVTLNNGFYTARVKRFGDYALLADTIAPVIRAVNFTDKKNVSGQENLRVTITDGLSGIAQYKGSLNGNWILMEYDAKNDMLTYTRDEKAVAGENEFLLEVTDHCGNRAVLKAMLRY